MENAVPQPLAEAINGNEARGKEDRADGLYAQGAEDHPAHHAHQTADAVLVERFLNDQACAQRHALAQHHEVEHGHRHEAQTADLDQQDDDHMAKGGKGRARVHDHQTCDAHAGGRGEQRVKKADADAVGRGDGQRQKQGAHEDDEGKPQHHHAGGAHGGFHAVSVVFHANTRSFPFAQFEAGPRSPRGRAARSPRSCTWPKRRPRPCGTLLPAPSRRQSRR